MNYLPSTTYGQPSQVNFPAPSAASVGSNVAQVPLANPYTDLTQVPGLSGLGNTNAAAMGDINSMLAGQLSPATVNSIQNYAASRGISGGMPGANIFQNLGAESIGQTAEGLEQQGIQDYPSFVGAVNSTQTNSPALQFQSGLTNAQNAAAPNPTAAASYAQQIYNAMLQQTQRASGGSGYSISGLPTTSTGTSGPTGNLAYDPGYGTNQNQFNAGWNPISGYQNQDPYQVFNSYGTNTQQQSAPAPTGGYDAYAAGF